MPFIRKRILWFLFQKIFSENVNGVTKKEKKFNQRKA
jgi:hypothetical protein